jgi:PPOX class probable F420-dependent enzyme
MFVVTGKVSLNSSERPHMSTSHPIPEAFRDLLDVEVAILATHGHDGALQVTAVWFLHDKSSDEIKLSLNDNRQKVKNLRRNPHATLFILDPANNLRSLEIRGHVELKDDADSSFVKQVGIKYGQDVQQYDQPGETRSIVILHPSKIHATNIGG